MYKKCIKTVVQIISCNCSAQNKNTFLNFFGSGFMGQDGYRGVERRMQVGFYLENGGFIWA